MNSRSLEIHCLSARQEKAQRRLGPALLPYPGLDCARVRRSPKREHIVNRKQRDRAISDEMHFVLFGVAYDSAPKAAGRWVVGSFAVSNSRFMRRNRFSKNS